MLIKQLTLFKHVWALNFNKAIRNMKYCDCDIFIHKSLFVDTPMYPETKLVLKFWRKKNPIIWDPIKNPIKSC